MKSKKFFIYVLAGSVTAMFFAWFTKYGAWIVAGWLVKLPRLLW